jgi:predicted nuclease with RNAse H fold
VITAGVDLATEPAKTATATITWTAGTGVVTSLHLGADDADIVDTTTGVDVLGIDCPLGWPDEFVAFLQAHHTGHVLAPADLDSSEGFAAS